MIKRPSSLVIFGLLVALFIVLLSPKVMHVFELNKRSDVLEQDLKKLRYQNRVLERELRMLRDDPVYLEKVAREELNKAKQGEIVYKLVRENSVSAKEAIVR